MEINYEEVKSELKKEFFGIDEQIDKIVDHIKTWSKIKKYQTKPYVVNLWGMSGVGKTKLVERTIKLCGLNDDFKIITANSDLSGLRNVLSRENKNGNILLIDEIQHLKTKDEKGNELPQTDNKPQSILLEYIDSGKFMLFSEIENNTSKTYVVSKIKESIDTLKYWLSIDILKGSEYSVLVNLNSFGLEDRQNTIRTNKDKVTFTSRPNYIDFKNLDISQTQTLRGENDDVYIRFSPIFSFGFPSEIGVMLENYFINTDLITKIENPYISINTKNNYQSLSSNDLLVLLEGFYEKLTTSDLDSNFGVINNKNSLIFVAGNLDECYQFSSDINSELDADWFYNKSLKISLIDIKAALQKRFRNEQIARLGSNHIIYPSLSKSAFEQIFEYRLNKFTETVLREFPDKVENIIYTDNIKKILYSEGVYPVQGCRPIDGIINAIIEARFPEIIDFVVDRENKCDILLDYNKKKKQIELTFKEGSQTIKTTKTNYKPVLETKKDKVDKNLQTAIAIHEVGHAIATLKLRKQIPDYIFSKTKNHGALGFCLTTDYEILSKRNWIQEIAAAYGGMVAEEIVLGKENIMAGSSSDINAATSLVTRLCRNNGFIEIDGATAKIGFKEAPNTFTYDPLSAIQDNDFKIQEQITKYLIEAKTLAQQAINDEKELFIKMVEYLSVNDKMVKKQIKEFVKKYAKTFTLEDISKEDEFYLNKLQEFKK